MKGPLPYYGGKATLAKTIIELIPEHKLYCEPFCGGAAVLFGKEPSAVEVINDTNRELINFYKVCQLDFVSLEKEIRISLHSRSMHRDAQVITNSPHMFNDIKRAAAVWILATQSFSAMLDGSWGYDKKRNTTSKKIDNKRKGFSEDFAIRLQRVQIECTDAIRIIQSRDGKDTFVYADPPYYNSDCGHYDGYSLEDYEGLLRQLSSMEGKFLLSSYHSDVLTRFAKEHGWMQAERKMSVSVNAKGKGERKTKVEVLTANYDISKALEMGFNLVSNRVVGELPFKG